MGCASSRRPIDSNAYFTHFPLPKFDTPTAPAVLPPPVYHDAVANATAFRASYLTALTKHGYSSAEEDALYNYPLHACNNPGLLGAYMSALPFCKYLEPGPPGATYLLLRLDGTSKRDDIRILGNILRDSQPQLLRITLQFDVDETAGPDFLTLSHATLQDGTEVRLGDARWEECVRSAFTEMMHVLSIEHAIWHLLSAHIVYVAHIRRCGSPISKLFYDADTKVYWRAAIVRSFLFGCPAIFQQTLNDNPAFTRYVQAYMSRFMRTFRIGSFVDDYFNLGELGTHLPWLPGMREEVNIIAAFVGRVVAAAPAAFTKHDGHVLPFQAKHHKGHAAMPADALPNTRTLLEMVLVLGAALHGTTFEFTKLFFTDAVWNPHMGPFGHYVVIGTLVDERERVFGQPGVLDCDKYAGEIATLRAELEEQGKVMEARVATMTHFKPSLFSTAATMQRRAVVHTAAAYI